MSIRIEDEGLGFKHDAVAGPTSPANPLRTQGSGIDLMRSLMDKVEFEQRGTVVHMQKRSNARLGVSPSPLQCIQANGIAHR